MTKSLRNPTICISAQFREVAAKLFSRKKFRSRKGGGQYTHCWTHVRCSRTSVIRFLLIILFVTLYGIMNCTDAPNLSETETRDLSNNDITSASMTSSSNDFIPIRLRLAEEFQAQKAFEHNEQKVMQEHKSRKEKPAVLAFYLSSDYVGFASYLNNGLNGYMLARKAGISFEFRVSSDWVYAPWKAVFLLGEDGVVKERGDVVSCPEVSPDGSLTSLEAMKSAKSGTEFSVCPFDSNWMPFRELLGTLEANNTWRDCFQTKRRFAQAIWHVHPKFEHFIKRRFELLLNNSEAFIAVHIRRGDKVVFQEMRNVEINEYVDAVIKSIDKQQYARVAVFVFSDDDTVIPSFRENLLLRSENNIQILTLRDFYDAQDDSIIAAKVQNGYDHDSFSTLGVTERMEQTRDFTLSLSIARFSDTFIGTLSSNVARLLALLRYNSDLDSNISLDDHWTTY